MHPACFADLVDRFSSSKSACGLRSTVFQAISTEMPSAATDGLLPDMMATVQSVRVLPGSTRLPHS